MKRAIFDSGRTQRELAEVLGMSEAHLSRVANGLHTDEATREAIADALGRQVDDLWPGDEVAA